MLSCYGTLSFRCGSVNRHLSGDAERSERVKTLERSGPWRTQLSREVIERQVDEENNPAMVRDAFDMNRVMRND